MSTDKVRLDGLGFLQAETGKSRHRPLKGSFWALFTGFREERRVFLEPLAESVTLAVTDVAEGTPPHIRRVALIAGAVPDHRRVIHHAVISRTKPASRIVKR